MEALRSVWQAEGQREALAEDCSPTKVCRNMRDFTFDGFAPEGTDLRTAWRARLAAEGKLRDEGETIRDLVLGSDASG